LVDIERACDEFEAAWRAGQRPQIEQFLTRGPAADQERLLAALLEIELELRGQAGETFGLEQYRCRFPDRKEFVEGVFRRVVRGQRLGDYELLEELGHGGMGVVYRARQVFLNQTVALKVLPECYLDEPQAIARFRREMQSIGALEHPNIVRAYNAGEAEGVHFLVMEYVDGVNLQRLVTTRVDRKQGPLGIGAACEVIRQAALGLQHAYEHGLVHRDIKPANLMLSRSGDVKLLDLGLAKLHASRRPLEVSAEPLTEIGTAMGTVDYMAPEQWEDSHSVDIRADIYSLGCTLFFLLSGCPPYSGESYGSQRKKLRAHLAAPIPSLVQILPDCPEDLDRMLVHMMAKDPDDRFDSPGELADAIGLFADRAELMQCLVAADESDRSGAASTPDLRSDADTAKRSTTPGSRRFRFSGPAPRRKPWYRRPVPLGLLALGFVVLAALGALALRHPGSPATPAVNPHLQADLAMLPGLNGQWWFDDMPWYTPFARQALAEAVGRSPDGEPGFGSPPSTYFNPNVAEVQKWLWEATSRCRRSLSGSQGWLLGELKTLADANLKDDQLAGPLTEQLRGFVGKHEGADWSAVDLHMRALLQHKLAAIQSNRQIAEEAKKTYDEALRAYGKAGSPLPLRLLCLTDAARLCSRVLGDFKEARRHYEEALAATRAPVLFRVEALATYGADAAAAGEYQDRLFEDARTLMQESAAGQRSHPLAAYIRERYAWSLMDQWKVEEASRQFLDAYRTRLTNLQESRNPLAAIYVFHNRHGSAMTYRYRGDTDHARSVFKKLVGDRVLSSPQGSAGEIEVALDEAEHRSDLPGQQRYLRDLGERWSNSMERWADCELYGGAASGAPVNLSRACSLYQKSHDLGNDFGVRVSMACKFCIAAALHGDVAKAREQLALLDADRREILEPDRERAGLLRQMAQAVLAIKDKNPAKGRDSLRHFLDQFKLNPAYTDTSRRETLELQLFAVELLLSSDLEANDSQAAQQDLDYLAPLLAVFRGRKDMRPFLRRFYDLAIRACSPDDLVQVAQYLLESRAVQRQGQLRSRQVTLLLFYFGPKEGFALVLPPEGRSGKRIPLTLTRQQIKEAASRGQSLSLPDELVKLVQEEQQAGHPIELSWCDAMCWPSEDEGLQDADWPFAGQLSRAAFKQP
jgi:serine/threonine protein kinase/tetratricopeptide (TPR) repeat protein